MFGKKTQQGSLYPSIVNETFEKDIYQFPLCAPVFSLQMEVYEKVKSLISELLYAVVKDTKIDIQILGQKLVFNFTPQCSEQNYSSHYNFCEIRKQNCITRFCQ